MVQDNDASFMDVASLGSFVSLSTLSADELAEYAMFLKGNVSELRESKRELQEKNRELTGELSALRGEVSALRRENQQHLTMSQELTDLRRKLDAMQVEKASWMKNYYETNQKLSDLQGKYNATKIEKDAISKDKDEVFKEYRKLVSVLSSIGQDAVCQQRAVTSSRECEISKKLTDLQQDLDSIKIEKDTAVYYLEKLTRVMRSSSKKSQRSVTRLFLH